MADEVQKVKREITLNNAIVFIGAGVSNDATSNEPVAGWRGLLKDGLQRCHHSGWIGDKDFDYFNNKFDDRTAEVDDYLAAADQIKDSFKKEARATKNDVYKTWLTETIGKLSVKSSELIKAIGELGCPILTTNYDSLLEDVLDKKPLTWTKYHTDGIGDSFENLKKYVLHVHGHYDEPDSVIFTSHDYDRICDNEFAQSKLRALMETKILLFIGYGSGMSDPNFLNLLKWKARVMGKNSLPIYKVVNASKIGKIDQTSDVSFLENVKEIPYGEKSGDLLPFIRSLKSFTPLLRENLSTAKENETIRKKYLDYLISEYGHVSIFGYADTNISLPLQSVYVELKFDPTHPSIKAMKTVEIHEEFKRKLLSYGFFDENERKKINRAIMERNAYSSGSIYKDFMVDQWLSVLLSNRKIFTEDEATAIKDKVNQLKRSVLEKSSLKEAKQYQIQQAYSEFKHFVILGHPGSGKTTISKWLVMNMAKRCLGEQSMLVDSTTTSKEKIPILIPIWKYVDHLKQSQNKQKKTLLQFIYENPTFDSTFFQDEERKALSSFIMKSLVQGNILVIFEGLDEVPMHIDRSDLMKEINALLQRGIDYDVRSEKLTYSIYEQKEINNVKDPTGGNRFIITSRIEGNYFEPINFCVPRLTIEDMSNEALRLFCSSYMECIKDISIRSGRHVKQYKPDQLYNDITQNKDIFQLAINPQLASVIAAIYNQYEDKLPDKRIDLYEKAIGKMIERLVTPHVSSSTTYLSTEFGLNATILWSILQEIAAYLHSKVEGLSEKLLKEIIRKCLLEYQQQSPPHLGIQIDDLISKFVHIFKYQAGLLSEFGHDSFRFIHRTFQEYLAGKSIIYSYGNERSADVIYENIKSKVGTPNWRVPLSMTFGILSKLSQDSGVFDHIITKLLTHDQTSSDTQFSTLLVPFVIIDSLNDMCFSSNDTEYGLIGKLTDMLLFDYKNTSGFARLKEHQQLIHSYLFKLKQKYDETIAEWLIVKLNHADNLAPCANIIYQLKWYKPKFHEIFLKNLHNDSAIWNWPIDSLLRFYSTYIKDKAVSTQLKFKNTLRKNPKIVQHIAKNNDWLNLIIALYGGYKNYNTPATISEYYEISQFVQLENKVRAPFIFYYQEVWGRDDPAHSMGVRAAEINGKHWNDVPEFDINEIYKESYLTSKILELLREEKSTAELVEDLRKQITIQEASSGEQMEILIALIALGDFGIIKTLMKEREEAFLQSFGNRIEQLIYVLKDPIARWSSHVGNYLLAIHNAKEASQLLDNLNFSDYCRIYLSLIATSGGQPVDTKALAEDVDDSENKNKLFAEFFALKFTGYQGNFRHTITELLDTCISSSRSSEIIKSFLKISDTVQIYKPVRAYPWSTDIFTFQLNDEDNIPIAFFNCLENINRNIALAVEAICNVLFKEGYFDRNPELIPLVILLHFAIMSKDLKRLPTYRTWLPDLTEKTNIKKYLFEKIQSMSNPYYKSRGMYQLAEVYDKKSYELLLESFTITKDIPEAVFKFQVLEKIFNIAHYKTIKHKSFIQQIVDELILTYDSIESRYDRIIASIRLSFYGSGGFRKKYLANAIKRLSKMEEDDDKIQLIIKLKPLVCIDNDLQIKLNEIIRNLKNKTKNYFVNSYYGRILSTKKFHIDSSNLTLRHSEKSEDDTDDEQNEDNPNYTELQSLFLLFAQLNETKLVMNKTESIDQLWINLFHDIDNQSNIEKILNIGLNDELFLTPQVAIIIDELIRNDKENVISILFPYIIKPSQEVLPIVFRWFTDSDSKQIKTWAALLLAEAKYIFRSAVDLLVDLLKSDNDQMRYRAQQMFQHPERDVTKPSKRVSVVGEKTLMKILQSRLMTGHLPAVQAYLNTFFFDLLWDDPKAFQNLLDDVTQLRERNPVAVRRMFFFDKIEFVNDDNWKFVMRTLQHSPHPLYVEELLHSMMHLISNDQISERQWFEFARILSTTDKSQFKENKYFVWEDVDVIEFLMNEICASTTVNDEAYFEILESKVIIEGTVKVEDLSGNNYDQVKRAAGCFFTVSRNDLNRTIVNMVNDILITAVIMENLINWLIKTMTNFKGSDDTIFSLMMCNNLSSLVSACAQKEDYLYRKITNSPQFNKKQMTKLLEKMVRCNPCYPARGSAFILLAAMDQADNKVIINALNTLFDENVVKKYSVIGIPLIRLSPNEFVDDLLKSLKNESAIKSYEILKILTQFALDEKIDANRKTKIIDYLAKEIGQLNSKKPVNYYYTDIKIPFTTTLESELYKTWIKIQGLSGKTQYSTTVEELIE